MAIASPPATDPLTPHPRWTRAGFHQLLQRDFAESDRHYELIEGEIFEKMGQKEPHIGDLMRWTNAHMQIFGPAFVRAQLPIVIDDESESEPDLSVAARASDDYLSSGETTPAVDIRLVLEISVTTLTFDLGAKALLCARGGIPENWVSDVLGRRLILHRDPTPTGYDTVVIHDESATVYPLAAPTSAFRVADYLP